MGRLNHAASRVHSYANQLLANTTHTYPPPWLTPIQTVPPSEKLIRPALQRSKKARLNPKIKHKPSRMFQPVPVAYPEDQLRWEYFNDHPWELAKPRVVIEGDGKDMEKWDWSVELDVALNRPKAKQRDAAGRTDEQWEDVAKEQAGRPLNGEA
jgi:small subunit ribosomal protein S23